MAVAERLPLCAFKLDKQFAAAGTHGWCPTFCEVANCVEDVETERGVLRCEIGESLHGQGFHDRAAIFKIRLQNVDGGPTFYGRERQARKHLWEMPFHFDLSFRGEETEELGLIRRKEIWLGARGFFCGVGGAHPNKRIVMPERLHHLGKNHRALCGQCRYLVGAAERAAIAAGEQLDDICPHSARL